jgi:hypothetical protein
MPTVAERLERVAERLYEEAGDCAQEAPLFPQHMARFLDECAAELMKIAAVVGEEEPKVS